MIRLIAILVIAVLVAFSAAWLADRQGLVLMTVDNLEIKTTVGIAALLLCAAIAVFLFVLKILGLVWRTPGVIRDWWGLRRTKKSYQALTRGLVAAAAGDADAAKRSLKKSGALTATAPLGLLLQAQAAGLENDEETQSTIYRAMLEHPDTEFLGLRGLFMQALRSGQEIDAENYATRAYRLRPRTLWAAMALFDLHARRSEWGKAEHVLDGIGKGKLLPPEIVKRRRAVLLAAMARDAEARGDKGAALDRATDALMLSHGLTPAALLAAKRLTQEGRAWKAQDLLEAAWAASPHPDLAEAYAGLHPDEDWQTRARRLRGLAKLYPNHFESRLLIAQQAMALKHWGDAKRALAPLVQGTLSARICAALADLAEKERNDHKEAEAWRARSLRAPRDAEWSCHHCGWAGAEWAPLCPHCGMFDTLTWSTPGLDRVEKLTPVEVERIEADADSILNLQATLVETTAAPGWTAPTAQGQGTIIPPLPDDPGPDFDTAETH